MIFLGITKSLNSIKFLIIDGYRQSQQNSYHQYQIGCQSIIFCLYFRTIYKDIVYYTSQKFKHMWLITLIGCASCALLNILTSKIGYNSIFTGDKDILLPFSVMIFIFYPLLIYLPEAHYKFLTYGTHNISAEQKEQEEEEDLPWAYIITLICISIAIIIHRIAFFNKQLKLENKQILGLASKRSNEANQTNSPRKRHKNVEYKAESLILKYYLSVAIGLQNIASSFYITIQSEDNIIRNQFIIYAIFSLFINFAYGYVNGWSAVNRKLHNLLTYSINFAILLGYLLGLIVQNNGIMLALPCLCCGLMMYSCALVSLPLLFSNGENHRQDKFRYGSVFTSLLMTVIYHPFCYLLRV